MIKKKTQQINIFAPFYLIRRKSILKNYKKRKKKKKVETNAFRIKTIKIQTFSH